MSWCPTRIGHFMENWWTRLPSSTGRKYSCQELNKYWFFLLWQWKWSLTTYSGGFSYRMKSRKASHIKRVFFSVNVISMVINLEFNFSVSHSLFFIVYQIAKRVSNLKTFNLCYWFDFPRGRPIVGDNYLYQPFKGNINGQTKKINSHGCKFCLFMTYNIT